MLRVYSVRSTGSPFSRPRMTIGIGRPSNAASRPARRRVGGRLHDRDRPGVLPRGACVGDEQVDMRLQEPAGAELNDRRDHGRGVEERFLRREAREVWTLRSET